MSGAYGRRHASIGVNVLSALAVDGNTVSPVVNRFESFGAAAIPDFNVAVACGATCRSVTQRARGGAGEPRQRRRARRGCR